MDQKTTKKDLTFKESVSARDLTINNKSTTNIYESVSSGCITSCLYESLLESTASAAFNASHHGREQCFEQTRVQIQREIHDWVDEDEEDNTSMIFWLTGVAGAGKSTISYTIARHYNSKQSFEGDSDPEYWIASFFFSLKNGVVDANLFVSTIAQQLARKYQSFRAPLDEILSHNKGIKDLALWDQWDELIAKPLLKLKPASKVLLLVVIDGLDECRDHNQVKEILEIINRPPGAEQFKHSDSNIRLRFMVSCRPEYHISTLFTSQFRRRSLDTTSEADDSQSDIAIYLEGKLEGLGILADGSQLKSLVKIAGGLFICADTIIKHLAGDPQGRRKFTSSRRHERLKSFIKGGGDAQMGEQALDQIYSNVLKSSILDHNCEARECHRTDIKLLLGDIAAMFSPLCLGPLSKLLERTVESINDIINDYGAILHIPEDESSPLRIHHACLSSFLFDKKRSHSSEFYIQREDAHKHMAGHCIQLMQKSLKIVLSTFSDLCISIDEIEMRSITPEIQYACRHWARHLIHCGHDRVETLGVLPFLRHNFVHWLVAMGILRMTAEAVRLVKDLQPLFDKNPEVSKFLDDGKRFILKNHQLAEVAPLQLYSSGLMFSPRTSVIRKETGKEGSKILRKMDETRESEIQVLEGHQNFVRSVSLSTGLDTQLLASGSYDNTVKLWDPDTGELLWSHQRHSDYVSSVAFSPSADMLASGSHDGTIILWSPDTGEVLRTIKETDRVISIAFSPATGDQFLASGCSDLTVKVRNSQTGDVQWASKVHRDRVTSVAFSPDGQILASGSHDKTIILWSSCTGSIVHTIPAHSDFVTAVSFSPILENRLLASGSYDKTIKIWDYCNPKNVKLRRTIKDDSQVTSVTFPSISGTQLLVCGSSNGDIRLWNPDTGIQHHCLTGHSKRINSLAFSSTRGAQLLVSGSDEKATRLWHINLAESRHPSLKPKGNFERISYLAFSSDGRLLATCSNSSLSHVVKIWDSSTGNAVHDGLQGHSKPVKCLAFLPHPTRQILVSASNDSSIMIWNSGTGDLVGTLENHTKGVSFVAFSPNGQLLASCSEDETVKIWNVNTWKLHLDYKSDHGEINIVTFSAHSKLLACASDCCTIKIFDCSTKQLIHNLAGHGKRINSIEFSPDGKLIASGSSDKTVKIWYINTSDLQREKTFEGHRAIVNSVSFSPNGKMLASSSVEGTIKIWHLDSDQPHRNLEHHTRWAWSQGNVGISIKNSQWICYGGEKKLWLPIEYREARLALKGNVLALSNSRGSVSFLIQEDWQETSNPKRWM